MVWEAVTKPTELDGEIGASEGFKLGMLEGVGPTVGGRVGTSEGVPEGFLVRVIVVGFQVGFSFGLLDGILLGFSDGESVEGLSDTNDGALELGRVVGEADVLSGSIDGAIEGMNDG